MEILTLQEWKNRTYTNNITDEDQVKRAIQQATDNLDINCAGAIYGQYSNGYWGNPEGEQTQEQKTKFNYLLIALTKATDYYIESGGLFVNINTNVNSTAGSENINASADNAKIIALRNDIRGALTMAGCYSSITTINQAPVPTTSECSDIGVLKDELWQLLFDDGQVNKSYGWSSQRTTTAINDSIRPWESLIQNNAKDIEDLKNKDIGVISDVDQLKKDVVILKGNDKDLGDQVQANQSDINDLKRDNETNKQNINTITNTTIPNLEHRVATNETDIHINNEDIANLQKVQETINLIKLPALQQAVDVNNFRLGHIELSLANGDILVISGVWSASKTYKIGNLVFENLDADNYGLFISIIDDNLNHQPSISPSQWYKVGGVKATLENVAYLTNNNTFTGTNNFTGTLQYQGNNVATENWVQNQQYATNTSVDNKISAIKQLYAFRGETRFYANYDEWNNVIRNRLVDVSGNPIDTNNYSLAPSGYSIVSGTPNDTIGSPVTIGDSIVHWANISRFSESFSGSTNETGGHDHHLYWPNELGGVGSYSNSQYIKYRNHSGGGSYVNALCRAVSGDGYESTTTTSLDIVPSGFHTHTVSGNVSVGSSSPTPIEIKRIEQVVIIFKTDVYLK